MRRYSDSQKKSALALLKAGHTKTDVAKRIGCSVAILGYWKKNIETEKEGPVQTGDVKMPTIYETLIAENKELKAALLNKINWRKAVQIPGLFE